MSKIHYFINKFSKIVKR